MPVLIAWVGRMLATYAGELALRALIGVGLGFATYHFGVTAIKGTITSYLNGGGQIVAYVGWLGIDKAVTIILSAWAGRLAVSAGKAALVKRSA